MTKGGKFFAVWDEKNGVWSTDEFDLIRIIDEELQEYVKELKKLEPYKNETLNIKYMAEHKSRSFKDFLEYVRMLPDRYKTLNSKIIFQNEEITKEDYATNKLSYPIAEGDTLAWDTLVSKLFSSSEKEKIEWAIGAVVTGDSKKIQKFLLFYGDPGTGKSTILDIVQRLMPKQ